jgi:hypothetical protein
MENLNLMRENANEGDYAGLSENNIRFFARLYSPGEHKNISSLDGSFGVRNFATLGRDMVKSRVSVIESTWYGLEHLNREEESLNVY